MANIKLPHKAFGTFIKAANGWLARTIDAKTGLEVRLANVNGKLHLSAGADANFIEAYLIVESSDLEALTQPIFLDIPTLSAYEFKTDGLTMTVPVTEKEDQRITFSVPGFNFRVPRKKGEIWKRNYFDLKNEPINGLVLDKESFQTLWKNLDLPNSFKTDRKDFQISFDIIPGLGFTVYGYDGLGALCHKFKNEKTQGIEGRMVFLEDFFLPCKAFEVEDTIGFSVSDRQCFAEFKAPASGIDLFRWTQPRFQRRPAEIPKILNDLRRGHVISLKAKPKSMIEQIERACMFFTPLEMRSLPIEFHTTADQYALLTAKSSGEGDVRVEGNLEEAPPQNLALNLHAACWKDYLGQFEQSEPIQMEILTNKTAILFQALDNREIGYWMPILPRTGDK